MAIGSSQLKTINQKRLAESSGPIDPFTEMRKQWDDSEDPMEVVLSWIAKAWREMDALLITQVDRVAWAKWKQLNSDKFRDAMELGQNLIYTEMRGVATGQTSRRGQAAAQRILLDILRNERHGRPVKPDPKAPKPAVGNSPNPRVIVDEMHEAMSDFDTEDLEKIVYGDGNAAD